MKVYLGSFNYQKCLVNNARFINFLTKFLITRGSIFFGTAAISYSANYSSFMMDCWRAHTLDCEMISRIEVEEELNKSEEEFLLTMLP